MLLIVFRAAAEDPGHEAENLISVQGDEQDSAGGITFLYDARIFSGPGVRSWKVLVTFWVFEPENLSELWRNGPLNRFFFCFTFL